MLTAMQESVGTATRALELHGLQGLEVAERGVNAARDQVRDRGSGAAGRQGGRAAG